MNGAAAIEPDRNEFFKAYAMQVREPEEQPLGGFSSAGGVAILANGLARAGNALQDCQRELMKPEQQSSVWLVNGSLSAVLILLQSHLDRISRFCQTREPLEEYEDQDIYFHTYSFRASSFVKLATLQSKILELRWKDQKCFAFMNRLKHEDPWFGLLSIRSNDGVRDIYDEQQLGAVYDFAIPLYKAICQVVIVLARKYDVSNLSFPRV